MLNKLYVGNFSFDTITQDLEQIFAEIGTVESVNISKIATPDVHADSALSKYRAKKKQKCHRTA